MKTVIVLIEKPFICPVPVSVPDWWDDSTAHKRLRSYSALCDLDDIADPDAWEESDDLPSVMKVYASSIDVNPVMAFGEDEPMPAHPDQIGLAL